MTTRPMKTVVPLAVRVMSLALLAAASVSAQPAPSPSPAAPEPPVFAVGTEAVHLDVFVARDGAPVPGLSADDFEVLDDGVRQQVEVVSGEPAATHALLVFDTSSSVAGRRLAELKAAGAAFVNGLRPEDRAGLLLFNHRARLAVPPGSDRSAVLAALAAARAEGGTALHDALFLGLGLADPDQGRPVLVVFSDGADRLSWLDPQQLVDVARQTEAVLYAVDASEPVKRDDWRPESGPEQTTAVADRGGFLEGQRGVDVRQGHVRPKAPPESVLRKLAAETGGQVWPAGGGELQQAFLDLLAEVRSRYVLRYQPAQKRKSGWHPVEVRLRNQPGAELRVRKGYFVP